MKCGENRKAVANPRKSVIIILSGIDFVKRELGGFPIAPQAPFGVNEFGIGGAFRSPPRPPSVSMSLELGGFPSEPAADFGEEFTAVDGAGFAFI